MAFTPELRLLALVSCATALMWIPYLTARIFSQGMWPALDNPKTGHLSGPAWAQRAKLAHANAVENLVVFAPLVVVATLAGIQTPGTVLAAKVYLVARLVHYVVFTAGIPVLRTLAFLAGFAATMTFAVAIISRFA
ncbi:MAPEG family protein [Dyella sp. GSA-30]|uniref:MAPEG family protein n=1 Tax=Dyella sp. GSA-30 TaxID=2994496 RepID=UPI00249115C7|nr:MAPEG family protein [Dyella sp. GSA-30]BDU22944.1 membrane protein [Dyella sp. GSA-30]